MPHLIIPIVELIIIGVRLEPYFHKEKDLNNREFYMVACLRIVKWTATPPPLRFLIRKLSMFDSHKTEIVSKSVELIYTVLVVTNFLAGVWIWIGSVDLTKGKHFQPPNSWVLRDYNQLGTLKENPWGVYILSLFFVWTVLATVGYGCYDNIAASEMWFVMFLEACSILVVSTILYSINKLVTGLDNSHQSRVKEYLNKVNGWLLKM